jgi:hypothetical protein
VQIGHQISEFFFVIFADFLDLEHSGLKNPPQIAVLHEPAKYKQDLFVTILEPEF